MKKTTDLQKLGLAIKIAGKFLIFSNTFPQIPNHLDSAFSGASIRLNLYG